MAESTYRRPYSTVEHGAFRAVSRREWGQPYDPAGGPAQFAGGGYWPGELRRKADEMERLIPLYRHAADALEREIATDPRCAAPVPHPAATDMGDGGGS